MVQACATVLNMGNVEFKEVGAEVFEVKNQDLTGQIAGEIQAPRPDGPAPRRRPAAAPP